MAGYRGNSTSYRSQDIIRVTRSNGRGPDTHHRGWRNWSSTNVLWVGVANHATAVPVILSTWKSGPRVLQTNEVHWQMVEYPSRYLRRMHVHPQDFHWRALPHDMIIGDSKISSCRAAVPEVDLSRKAIYSVLWFASRINERSIIDCTMSNR
jgi:hypothetical protein